MNKIIKTISIGIFFSLFLVIAMLFVGSSLSSSDKLAVATQLIKEHPDSAYVILHDVDYNELDADSLKAKYILTKALVDIRIGRSLITDTLLNDAASYYIAVGDTSRWVQASQLLSDYNFTRGDSEAALHRLEKIIPQIKNQELRCDIYNHILELSINSLNYTRAYNYADWLLTHAKTPEQILKYSTTKASALYYQGNYKQALSLIDSVIDTRVLDRVQPEVSSEFYQEYAELLDGAGYSRKAIEVIDSLYQHGYFTNDVENVTRKIALAQFYANLGNTNKAITLLDSINHDGTQSVFEVYAGIGMLKAALQFKQSGRYPSELMHKVTKNIHRNYGLAQFDRQTAMESVIEISDDNYKLKLQRQQLWLLIAGISLLAIVGAMVAYFMINSRKQRLIEAEERAETLEGMLKDYEKTEKNENSSDSEKLKAALLRQLGILKTLAEAPTPQSRNTLKKISSIGNSEDTVESLVNWSELYSMIDSLYDNFHTILIKRHPGTFNDKEQQIIVLLKAGFSTKEIGVLTEQSSATIYTRKSVIRKKLGTPESGDFIAQLEEEFKAI